MLLPGPEAQQLAIYLGWLLHRVKGGVVAGVMFVLPSVFVTFGLSWLFAAHGDVGWVSAIFAGLAPAVIAVVAAATIRIGTKALANWLMLAVAVVAFVVAIFVLHVPFPIIVLGAALIGLAGAITRPASSTSLTSWRSRSGSRSVTTGLAPRTRCRRKPGPRASSSSASSSGSCRSQRSPPGAGPKTHSPR
jgi:chromate transporter